MNYFQITNTDLVFLPQCILRKLTTLLVFFFDTDKMQKAEPGQSCQVIVVCKQTALVLLILTGFTDPGPESVEVL